MSRLTQGQAEALPVRDYHPLSFCFPDKFRLSSACHWPGPRSLATTSGVSVDVLSSGYLDVSVPRVRLKPPILFRGSYLLLITGNPKPSDLSVAQLQSSGHRRWVSPFGNPRIKASSQLPVGLSQRSTSFIASQRQGIHRMPLRHLIALIINAHPPLGSGTVERRSSTKLSPTGRPADID